MKRQFGLLLASVLLVFALTACGGDDILDAGEDILDPNDKDHADSGRDPADRHEDDALTGGDPTVEDAVTKQSGRIGVSYGQMLRNARVHDTDGFLKDGENAVSPDAL